MWVPKSFSKLSITSNKYLFLRSNIIFIYLLLILQTFRFATNHRKNPQQHCFLKWFILLSLWYVYANCKCPQQSLMSRHCLAFLSATFLRACCAAFSTTCQFRTLSVEMWYYIVAAKCVHCCCFVATYNPHNYPSNATNVKCRLLVICVR